MGDDDDRFGGGLCVEALEEKLREGASERGAIERGERLGA